MIGSVTVIIVLITFTLVQSNYLLNYKQHPDCDLWAERDKECVNNPRYMWSACIGSCLQYAEDVHDNCERWAAEGECTENPNYIHLHCPRSCVTAVAWNPWVRRRFGIDELALDDNMGKDTLQSASNLFAVADIISERLHKFMNGLSSAVNGLSSAAPTEYLGMLGLAEGFLYTLRIHEIILHTLHVEEEIIAAHHSKIMHILQVLKSGYSSDRIMLQLPSWLRFIEASRQIVLEEIKISFATDGLSDDMVFSRMNLLPSLQFSTMVDYLLGEHYAEEATESFLPEGAKTVALSNGVKIPLIGLGTWQMEGKDCEETVYQAIRFGYRLIDTAEAYQNENYVGNAIRRAMTDGLVSRSELYIATKLSDPSHYGYENIQELVQRQLQLLQIDYIDLYMLHSPHDNLLRQNETWEGLLLLQKQGKIRSLGISNFNSQDLSKFLDTLGSFPTNQIHQRPVILQNKLDIYHVGKQIDIRGDTIISYAREQGITMMAYSPFSAYPFVMEPYQDPIIQFIAQKYTFQLGKLVTPAQIILKWIIQRGMTVIPRSMNSQRLQENLATYDLPNLTKEYMNLIDAIQYLVSSPVSVPILPIS